MVKHLNDCVEIESTSPEETRELGRRVGACCHGGEVLLLVGDLGSGKTCFVQGMAKGLDVPRDYGVTSPTFILHTEYPGRLVLNHLDLYRLIDNPEAVAGLGFEDFFGDVSGVTAVEWPDMLPASLTQGALTVRIEDAGDGRRRIRFSAEPDSGPRVSRSRKVLSTFLEGV